MSLVFVHLLDNRISDLRHTFGFAFEEFHSGVECLVGQFLFLLVTECFFRERSFHGKRLEQVHFAVLISRSFDGVDATVPNHVHNIHADTLTHQSVAAFGVDHGTLFVHDIIIFQQTLTDTEVVFFHLLLRTFDRLGNHAVLNHFAFLETEFVHYAGNTVGREQTHQVVFQRHEEYG